MLFSLFLVGFVSALAFAVAIDQFSASQAASPVTVTSPAKGSTVSGTVTLSASVDSSLGATKVTFRRIKDGQNVKIKDNVPPPFNYSWDTSGLSGTYTIKAFAYAGTALKGTSAADYPVTVGSGGGGSTCGNNTREGTEQCDGADLNSQTCSTLGFTSGTLGCTNMCAFDTSSCSNTGGGGGSLSVTLTSPAGGSEVSGLVPFTATASGPVSEVAFKVDGVTVSTDSSAPYEVPNGWDSTKVSNGTHFFRAKARDAAGNYVNTPDTPVTVGNAGGGGGTSVCGNNTIETGEDCDGSLLGGATCASQGFLGGTLSCYSAGSANPCKFNTSSCTNGGGGGTTQCNDGVDNDGDGKKDYGTAQTHDPGCSSASDDDETDQVSGGGGSYTCKRTVPPGTTGKIGVSSGDVLCFQRGVTYNGVYIESGANSFTIGATGTGSKPVLDGGRVKSVIAVSGTTGVQIFDIAVRNATNGINVADAGKNIWIENVESYNNTQGIALGRGSGHTIKGNGTEDGCFIHNNDQNGIVFDSDNVKISGCIIKDNSKSSGTFTSKYHGIYASGGCLNATIENNKIENVGDGNGINYKCPSGSINGNKISGTGDGIHLEDQLETGSSQKGTITISRNLVRDNERGIILYNDGGVTWDNRVSVIITNNTVVSNNNNVSTESDGELEIQVKTEKVTVRDNVFVADKSCVSNPCQIIATTLTSQTASSFVSDNNCYYREDGGSNAFNFNGSRVSFSDWQSKSKVDANSVFINPQLGSNFKATAAACAGKGI
jgi:hypothetical protein